MSLKVVVGGSVLRPGWTGGEPAVAHRVIDGIRQRGHAVEVLYRRSFARSLVGMASSPLDWDIVSTTFYEEALRASRPDVVLGFYDHDVSLARAAAKLGVPFIVCAQIHWPVCPIGTLYIEGFGQCPGPSATRCVRHMSSAVPNAHLPIRIENLPPPVGAAIYTKFRTRFRGLHESRAVIAPSRRMAEMLAHAGYPNVRVVPSGIELAQWPVSGPPQSNEREILLPTASDSERKGLNEFRQAALALRASHPGVRCVVTNHRSEEVLSGTPYLTHEGMVAQFARSYGVVIPILWEEPFGLVYLEAMASGRPIVTYDVGAASEIVENGVSGLIVPRGDTTALVAALRRLLDDEAMARRMGLEGRRRVESVFTAERMVDGYLGVIDDVLDGRSRGG